MSFKLRFKSTVLLGTLLSLILLYPFFGPTYWGSRFLIATTIFVIIGGLLELQNDRRWFLPAVIIAIPTTIVSFQQLGTGEDSALLSLLQAMMYALLAANLVIYTIRPGDVTMDKLAASVSGYLLLGFTWGAIYRLMELCSPGSIVSTASRQLEGFDFLYFSFVTLTTLGYGDIAPVTDRARSLVILEAVVGSMYLVVLVSRLVPTHGQLIKKTKE